MTSASLPHGPERPRANILVVDDDANNLFAIAAVLEPLGQNVVRASSGEKALAHLLDDDFAVILIDVNMPGMDGLQTAAAIKSRERTRHTPIIFLTGVSTEPGQIFKGYAYGAVDYLLKPFEPGVLRCKVMALVELFLRGEQVKQLNAELERRVAERTRDLASANAELRATVDRLRETQEQLIHSGKMAAVGSLVAGLSHELNNPLAIVLNGTQSALRKVGAEHPARETLVLVQSAAERCGRLVRSLLEFSRRATTREPVDPATLCARVIGLLDAEARERNVQLDALCEVTAPEALVACVAEVETALLNLLTNAIDATTPDGAVQLAVRAVRWDQVDGVEFAVIDTGPGIPSNVLPRIFEPFFTTKAMGTGTGLGLPLARQIVEAHGGHLRVESSAGAGTTVRVWLPCAEPGAAAVTAPRRPTPRHGLVRPHGGGSHGEGATFTPTQSATIARVTPEGEMAQSAAAANGEDDTPRRTRA